MACTIGTPTGCVADAVKGGLDGLAASFASSADWTVKNLTAAWLGTPSPEIMSATSPVRFLQDQLLVFVAAAVFLSVLYAAGKMALSGTFESGLELGASVVRLVVVSGCAAVVTSVALEVGDLWTTWIMSQSHASFSAPVLFSAITSPALVLLLALVAIVAQVVQFFIMMTKNVLIVIALGVLPLTSAATNVPVFKGGYQKLVGWLIAIVLYKPVAATIYALSYKMASKDQSITGQLSGFAAMILSVVALPALLKFTAPLAAASSGGNAGAVAGAVVGATLATGAVIATGGGAAAAGGLSGAAGAAGPSGAMGATGAAGPSGMIQAATAGASAGGASGADSAVDK